jgi:quinol monooxygenase YgiN
MRINLTRQIALVIAVAAFVPSGASASGPQTDQISVLSFQTAPPAETASYEAAVRAFIVKVRNEPGCIEARLDQNRRDPNRFVIYGVFKDQAAFDAHLAAAHTKAIIKLIHDKHVTLDYDLWAELPPL